MVKRALRAFCFILFQSNHWVSIVRCNSHLEYGDWLDWFDFLSFNALCLFAVWVFPGLIGWRGGGVCSKIFYWFYWFRVYCLWLFLLCLSVHIFQYDWFGLDYIEMASMLKFSIFLPLFILPREKIVRSWIEKLCIGYLCIGESMIFFILFLVHSYHHLLRAFDTLLFQEKSSTWATNWWTNMSIEP